MIIIKNLTRRVLPARPFRRLANRVLGQTYDLSLVFIGRTRARILHRRWLGKDEPAKVLGFPLDRQAGEIFLNPGRRRFAEIIFLFIHGLLHLKGLKHGSKMESLESQLIKFFQNHEQNHHRGTRHRQRLRARRRL